MDTLLSISTTNPENSNFQWYKNNQMIAGAVSSELEIVSPEIAQHDIYYCLVSNNCKSIESQDIDLHIFNLPDLVLPEDTTISTNDTLRIDAGSGFQEYLWNTGYENQILTIYGNEPGVYSYSVKVTDENSCSATEGITVTVASLSSINESFLNSDFKIYPNPVYDIIYLKTLNSISEEITISIVDITGKILLQKKFDNLLNSLIYQINVSDLAKGVYYLQIGNKQMIKVEKIVMN
jgi:hypothetical protein